MRKFLVETALLAQGICPEIKSRMNQISLEQLVWIESGEFVCGNMVQYLEFLAGHSNILRGNMDNIPQILGKREHAVLTASGAMFAAKKLGYDMVISAGIGGIGGDQPITKCHDLEAVKRFPITLLATAPKDMFLLEESIKAYRAKVPVYGLHTDRADGFLFQKDGVELDGGLDDQKIRCYEGRGLLLNPIQHQKRIQNTDILEQAIEAGKEAINQHQEFHPAVCRYLDQQTNHQASRLQLQALLSNYQLMQ